jgi:phosphate transport system substrate-binding protein
MVLKGSSTGIAGLTAGVSAFAPMGREAWPSDLSGFRETFGYAPLDIRVGYDAYTGPKRKSPPGIYVNQKNPLRDLTLAQIRRILTAGAAGGDVTHWGQLGLTGKWAHRTIHLYGPRDEGGFATSLRMTQLGKLPFAARYEPLAKNADIAEAVAADPFGLGLISFFDGATAPAIRMVPVAGKTGEAPALASYDEVKAGKYPLSPELHFYLNRAPGHPVDPVVAAYFELVLSPEGQAILASEKDSDEGYVPLAPEQLEAERAKLR